MKTKTITIVLGIILMISLASAIYAGESYTFESEEFAYYTVVGNSSDMEGMNITWEDGNTTITFDIAYKPDNFTLVLFNIEKEVITEHHYSGGGGGTRTIYKDKEIIVTEVVEVIEYVNQTEIEIKEIEKVGISKLLLTLAILLLLSAFVIIFFILRNRRIS